MSETQANNDSTTKSQTKKIKPVVPPLKLEKQRSPTPTLTPIDVSQKYNLHMYNQTVEQRIKDKDLLYSSIQPDEFEVNTIKQKEIARIYGSTQQQTEKIPKHVKELVECIERDYCVVSINQTKLKMLDDKPPTLNSIEFEVDQTEEQIDDQKSRKSLEKELRRKSFDKDQRRKSTDKNPMEQLTSLDSVVKNTKYKKLQTLGKQTPKTQLTTQQKEQPIYAMEKLSNIPEKDVLSTIQSMKSKHSFVELFQHAYPLSETKKQLNFLLDQPDLFFEKTSINELKMDTQIYLLFSPQQLNFDLFKRTKKLERLFCSVALYSGTTKISETFKFEWTPQKEPEQALFSLDLITDKVFILFKFSRAFKGEFTDYLNDYYLKGEKIRDRDLQKVDNKLDIFEDKLRDSHITFAFSVINAMEILQKHIGVCDKLFFLKNNISDEALMKLTETGETIKRFKTIPGSFQFKLQMLQTRPEMTYVDESKSIINIEKKPIIVRDISSFQMPIEKTLKLTNYLYVYPRLITVATKRMQNIQVVVSLMEKDSNINDVGIKCCFEPITKDMKTYGFTEVSYKTKMPEYSDELKFKLPCVLTEQHHLLFKFLHVNHKKDVVKNESGYVAGYAFLKIFDGKKILNGTYQLPMYKALPSYHYTTACSEGDKFNSGKLVFTVKIATRSAVFPACTELNELFRTINQEPTDYEALAEAINGCVNIIGDNSSYAPIILNQVFSIMRNAPKEQTRQVAFNSMMGIVQRFISDDKQILCHYVKYTFNFDDICENLYNAAAVYLEENINIKLNHGLFKVVWFMLSILLKSLILHIAREKKTNSEINLINIQGRIAKIIDCLRMILATHVDSTPVKVKKVNHEISVFLKALLSFLDRQFILSIGVNYITYLSRIKNRRNSRLKDSIIEMELTFFDEILSYHNYALLLLPPSTSEVLSMVKCQKYPRHFIYTAFAETIVKCLYCSRESRMKAITVLRLLLYRTSRDPRYQQQEFRERINGVHFELLLMLLDAIHDWKQQCEDPVQSTLMVINSVKKKLEQIENEISAKEDAIREIIKKPEYMTGTIRESLVKQEEQVQKELSFLENSKKSIQQILLNRKAQYEEELQISRDEKRHLLSSFMHIISGMNQEILRTWWVAENRSTRQVNFLLALQMCNFAFEYRNVQLPELPLYQTVEKDKQDNRKSALRNFPPIPIMKDTSKPTTVTISRTSSEKSIFYNDSQFSSSAGKLIMKSPRSIVPALRGLGAFFTTTSTPENISPPVHLVTPRKKNSRNSLKIPANIITSARLFQKARLIDKNLSFETSLFVLESLINFVNDNKEAIYNYKNVNMQPILENIIKTFLSFMRTNQSNDAMLSFIVTLYNFLNEYNKIILQPTAIRSEKKGTIAEMLCGRLVAVCNYKVNSVRMYAAALLYHFIKFLFEVNDGSVTPKVITTMALSKTLKHATETKYLSQSIEEILQYTTRVAPQKAYSKEIKELCIHLQGLLKDTLALKDDGNSYSKEDALYRICVGYYHIPELHFIWLKQLAKFHSKKKRYVEAAQCYVSIIAIVLEFLTKVGSPILNDIPIQLFYKTVSPDMAISLPDEKAKLPHAVEFTEAGLIKLIEKAITLLDNAQFYENAVALYKILIAFFERSHQYSQMAKCYDQIKTLCEAIDKSIKHKNRFLAEYYRIRFFGKAMGDENGKQYVYKFPKLFRLFQVVNLVKDLVSSKGVEAELIDDPSTIKQAELEAKVFVQITNLKPYTDDPTRKTFFERNTNINKFYCEVPFNPDKKKKSHGIKDNYTKRTIFTTANYFPYITSRIPIINEEEIILTPIEAAIQVIKTRNLQLEDAMSGEPDVQTLQLCLQGAVRASVNGGPKEIVDTFLGKKEKYDPKFVEILNEECHRFLKLCWQSLQLELRNIQPHQRQFHIEIEKGFYETKEFFEKRLIPLADKPKQPTSENKSKSNVTNWSTKDVLEWVQSKPKLKELQNFVRVHDISGDILLKLTPQMLNAYKVPLKLAVELMETVRIELLSKANSK